MIEVHHLNNSRWQRILWLLEELGLEYQIVPYQRDRATRLAPPSLKAIHPLGKSPVIRDGPLVLAESAGRRLLPCATCRPEHLQQRESAKNAIFGHANQRAAMVSLINGVQRLTIAIAKRTPTRQMRAWWRAATWTCPSVFRINQPARKRP
jgi:hypothetical protein